MAFPPADLTPEMIEFVTVRHLATLTTQRADGSPHVVPVGFSYDASTQRVRIISGPSSQKSRNAARGSVGLVCQVDGGRWLTLSGPIRVLTDADAVADAERVYAQRYRTPKVNPARVVLLMDVHKIIGRVPDPPR